MKKLLLIAMLLLSGLAHAAKPALTEEEKKAKDKEITGALMSADAAKVSTFFNVEENKIYLKSTWIYQNGEQGEQGEQGVTNFKLILRAKQAADKPDTRIATFEVLIQAGYQVTLADLQLCFVKEHKAILEALTKMVKVAKNQTLVEAILKQEATVDYAHFTPEFKKELLGNLISVHPGLLQEKYVIDVLFEKEENDSIVKWLVNQGAMVSPEAKALVVSSVDDKTNLTTPNPRAQFLVKDSEQVASSIVAGKMGGAVLGVSAGLIVALVIWKNYRKEIKAFFAG